MLLKKQCPFWGFLIITMLSNIHSKAQTPFDDFEALFFQPKHYITYFAHQAPVIDGNITDTIWQSAQWSDYFVDISGKGFAAPRYDTRVKMAWNETHLFIAARMEEPHVWATLKKHDAIIYYDNDFEVFIDPDNNTHQYFEIEVNAFNTIFDLFMPKPYRNGGKALISWNIDKLRSAVQIQGTLNNPSDIDTGWTVEMAIPFNAIAIGSSPKIPDEGTLWRINFSRVQWDTYVENGKYVKQKDKNGHPLPEHNWVWSPQGVINMHYPERWGYLIFSKKDPNSSNKTFTLPLPEKLKRYLWLVYYKQKEYHQNNGYYSDNLLELSLEEAECLMIDHQPYSLQIEATKWQFNAIIQGPGKRGYRINQEGLIQTVKPTP